VRPVARGCAQVLGPVPPGTRCTARADRLGRRLLSAGSLQWGTVAVVPETRYAEVDGLAVAYQVWGDGPVDVVLVPQLVSHLEGMLDVPGYSEWIESLAGFSRLVVFDKRGNGMSDRIPGAPSLEERVRDISAVMDAVGFEQAALLGVSEGAAMSLLFAALHPERVTRVATAGGAAAGPVAAGRVTEERHQRDLQRLRAGWGQGDDWWLYRLAAPSLVEAPAEVRRLYERLSRMSSTPRGAVALWEMYNRIDIRAVLGLVECPVLVQHRADEHLIWAADELLARLRDAEQAIVAGRDHPPWVGNTAEYVAPIRQFLLGDSDQPAHPVSTRTLATVLFTDLVASTELEVRLGDDAFRRLLNRLNMSAQRHITRFCGRLVKSTGDGLLAIFDAPTPAVRCALAMRDAAAASDLGLRCGIHTGEIEHLDDGDISGINVNIAARICSQAGTGQILLSDLTRQLTFGSGYTYLDTGPVQLKGVPGEWTLASLGPGGVHD